MTCGKLNFSFVLEIDNAKSMSLALDDWSITFVQEIGMTPLTLYKTCLTVFFGFLCTTHLNIDPGATHPCFSIPDVASNNVIL